MRKQQLDEVPMLSYSQQHSQDESPHGVEMSRSVSLVQPVANEYGLDATGRHDIRFSAPLRNIEKEPVFRPLSGPLQAKRNQYPSRANMSGRLRSRVEPEEGVANRHPDGRKAEDVDRINHPHDVRHGHLMRSGPLGKCSDPFCTTCPAFYDPGGWPVGKSGLKSANGYGDHIAAFGNVRTKTGNFFSWLRNFVPGIMSPHAKVVQQWNKFFVISCLVAIFLDPLFFFLLYANKEEHCIVLNWNLAVAISVLRSLTDFVYFLHMLLQFRLAYVAPESRSVGAGDLVDNPREIARHYLAGYFLLDLFVVLPLPQIIMLVVLPNYVGNTANYAKNMIRITILVQYIPRMIRFVPLFAGSSPTGLIFESAWANFVINLLIFILAGHVVGSCWYLLALQRVNQCLRNACNSGTDIQLSNCLQYVDCGQGNKDFSGYPDWTNWKKSEHALDCFKGSDSEYFSYGIYETAVPITISKKFFTKYIYSLFWGFQVLNMKLTSVFLHL